MKQSGKNVQVADLTLGKHMLQRCSEKSFEPRPVLSDVFAVLFADPSGGDSNKRTAVVLLSNGVVDDIVQGERSQQRSAKPIAVTNDNPLAIWLNYLLYHVSMTNPGREHASKIEPASADNA
jgi:hypothetical protein